jgi:SAM-dependent methyltransferase
VITVFTADEGGPTASAFARHLHEKWDLPSPAAERQEEDRKALGLLGVEAVEHWGLPDAPCRCDATGHPRYASYDELKGPLHPAAQGTIADLVRRIEDAVPAGPCLLYFPLGLGSHVDHSLLFEVGLRLRARGRNVRFYEDWPYAEAYESSFPAPGWVSESVDISVKEKLRAVMAYRSQVAGLGGNSRVLRTRLRRYAKRVGAGRPQERYWFVTSSVARKMVESESDRRVASPGPRTEPPRLRDFWRVIDMLRWHDLGEVLPKGKGVCLEIGCGTGRHRQVIEERGYDWVGLDREATGAPSDPRVKGDVQKLPFASGNASAVIAWQVMEYVESPEEVIREAFRTLEPGGVFCGSVSFLEPVHGRTLYGISPLLLEQLLRKQGFVDINIRPGLCGFALMLWTWLRRLIAPSAGALAIPLTAAWLLPLAALRFLVSWVGSLVGLGGGHAMRWLTKTAPLEFAGHVIFTARKPARREPCT